MRFIKFSSLIAFTGFVFYGCDPCNNLDCVSSNYYGQFRVIKKSDGTDLVFGANRIYEKHKIKFYSLKGTDTTFFYYSPTRFPNTGYDSILQVHFYPQVENAYMDLGNGDIDTLKISYKTFDTKCCGTITEITNFRLNNSIDIPGNQGTQEIKK